MPSVLNMNSAMNQTSWPFLPALHRATPFHAISHTTARDINSHSRSKFGKNGHVQPISIFNPLMFLWTNPSPDLGVCQPSAHPVRPNFSVAKAYTYWGYELLFVNFVCHFNSIIHYKSLK